MKNLMIANRQTEDRMNFKDSLNSFMHTLPVIMGTFIVIRFDYEIIYILPHTRFVRSPVDYSVQSS